MTFWEWVQSGWGDAAAQWSDPVGSVENSIGSVIGVPNLGTSGDGSSDDTGAFSTEAGGPGGTPTPATGASTSWQPWAIGFGVILVLFLVVVLLREVEGII